MEVNITRENRAQEIRLAEDETHPHMSDSRGANR